MAQETLPLQNVYEKTLLNNSSQKVNFNGIDIMKFLCAILICAIHLTPFTANFYGIDLNFWLQQALCRIAVPFYFVCAGFFLFKKIGISRPDMGVIKNYCFKIARLLGIWTIVLFVGEKAQLWYLGELFIAVLVLSFLFYFKVKLRYICLIAAFLYVIGMLGDSYYGFIEPLENYTVIGYIIRYYNEFFYTTRNGLFFGLPFVLMGAVFAKTEIKMNGIVALIGFIFSLVALFCEAYALSQFSNPKDYNVSFCLLPTTFFLFYLCSHIKLNDRPIYIKLRIYGILIYFLHLFVCYFVDLAFTGIKHNFEIDLLPFRFLLCVIISLFIAVLIEKLSRIKTFRWLKYLYS